MGIQSDKYASYKLLAKELSSMGYTALEHVENDKTIVTFTSPEGAVWSTRVTTLRYPFTTPTVVALSTNKEEATKHVLSKGINAPATLRLVKDSIDELAIEDFLYKYKRIVVKPLDRSLSLGLTTDIMTMPKALRAVKNAAEYSSGVLLQEQVFGDEVRFAVIDGKVSAALMRRTPRVVGDGVSTVAELVAAENEQRKAIDYTLVQYPLLTADLIHKSVDMSAVPAEGEVVELSRATMISRGCSVSDVLEQVHPSYIEIVEGLVRELDAGFIVVDIFLKDFHEPAADDNYWFIEFNTSPVLKLFYSCRDGKMHDIIPVLAKAIDKKIHMRTQRTVGGFEVVDMPLIGIKQSVAKIDTGAYSGAIGCSSIGVVKKGGKKILRFSPGKQSKRSYETETFSEKHVKSSNGQREKRYLIDTELVMQERSYPITITLSDRSDMKHEILIGRRFLREHNLLVDVSINQEYDTDSEAK